MNYDIIYLRLSGFTDTAILNTVAFFLFIGAMGKSAQIPLYVWLPDAMAGPTPVSALIHAATMVTSGVFMIARLSPVFLGAPDTSTFIAFIGGATALFAALIALTQTDIKKVLAYSTVSQLGYMFMAMGVGAYGAGMFHLMTHAFFKALLFLGSGAVIIALHHEQDMRRMGGLFKHLKLLAIIFWVAAVAISGIPGFSGFFSKDMILEQVYAHAHGGKILFAMGIITALLTSFYIFRLIYLTFHTKEDAVAKMARRHHEGDAHHAAGLAPLGWTIYFPLIVLAILSAIGGYVGLPHLFTHETPSIVSYFDKVLAVAPSVAATTWKSPVSHSEEMILMASSIVLAFLGLVLAYFIYQKKNLLPIADGAYRKPLVKWSFNKFYIDELYDVLVLNPLKKLAFFSYRVLDSRLLDGMIDGLASVATTFGNILRRLQTGFVGDYAVYFIIGILVAGFLAFRGVN